MRIVALVVGLVAPCLAGCSCEPDGGLGPRVGWTAQSPRVNTGEPVTLGLSLSAMTTVGGTPLDHHCEPDNEPLEGTARITPAGGTPIVASVQDGRYMVDIPYASSIGLRFDARDGQSYTKDWMLPAVFEVATSSTGTALHVTWTTPEPLPENAPEAVLAVRLAAGTSVYGSSVPDSGSADVELSRLTAPAGSTYHAAITRTHPAVPSVHLTIVATFVH